MQFSGMMAVQSFHNTNKHNKYHNAYLRIILFVSIQDDVRVAVVEPTVIVFRPVFNLRSVHSDHVKQLKLLISSLTLNFTILQIWRPSLSPAFFHAGSVKAEAFFT